MSGRDDWSAFDDPPPLGGRRARGSRGRGGRRPAPPREDHGDRAPRQEDYEPRRTAPEPWDDHQPAPAPRRRPAEEQVYLGHPHWRSMLGFYAKSVLGVLLAGVVCWAAGAAGVLPTFVVVLGPLALAALLGWIASLIRRTTVYSITTRRITKRWGIFMKFSEEAPRRRIQNVMVGQSIWERLLGIGTLDFDTAGEREGDLLRMWGVRDPWRVRSLVQLDDEDDF